MHYPALIRCLVVVAALCGPTLARAQPCKPQQLLNSVRLQPTQGGLGALVPVTINGTPLNLLLDTAGYTTQLFTRTVDRLGLPPERSTMVTVDVEGNTSRNLVTVSEFVLGQLTGKDFKIQIFPVNSDGGNPPLPFDGILANDMLIDYDIDIDFGNGVLNLFARDHCPGDVIYWAPQQIVSVPFELLDQSHIRLAVTLDGKPINAILDTGSSSSVMRAPLAQSLFGIEEAAPGDIPVTTINGGTALQGFNRQFSTLGIGSALIRNPRVSILRATQQADQSGLSEAIRSRLLQRQDDLIIGMDVLKYMHIYIATAERKLYFSAATPAFVSPSDTTAP